MRLPDAIMPWRVNKYKISDSVNDSFYRYVNDSGATIIVADII